MIIFLHGVGSRGEDIKVEESQKMVDRVNECGGNAKLTVYPENMHDSWSDTYKNKDLFEWLLTCKNQDVKVLKDGYN